MKKILKSSFVGLALLMAGCATSSKPPEDCPIQVEGVCYTDTAEACAAAGCPDDCSILRSYPGQVACGSGAATATKPILFVVTNHTELGQTGKKTGYFLSEVTHPWHVVTEAGFTVEFVSPKGGKVEMDPKSHNLEDPINSAFLADPKNVQALENTKAPGDIRPSDYSAIYFAGGHGAMWDFPANQVLADVASSIWQAGGVVAAVCHGPAGLVDITLPDGSYLVAGKRVAAFTNEEEAAVELTEVMPFLLATRLEERGAIHVPGPNFQQHVIVDDRLVTGQNPASAQAAGTAIVELLRVSNPAKE